MPQMSTFVMCLCLQLFGLSSSLVCPRMTGMRTITLMPPTLWSSAPGLSPCTALSSTKQQAHGGRSEGVVL